MTRKQMKAAGIYKALPIDHPEALVDLEIPISIPGALDLLIRVEAISVNQHAGFALGVQWHPEWQAATNEVSRKLFAAFGDACRAWSCART